jgi:FkbM family methyltransferase
MNVLELELADGVTIAVPGSLQSITAYVLLEQERWFEKEMDFLRRWLRPGMTVIDVGANVGVYSLPMARLVGPSGRVFAYEPSSETRALLEHSRVLNKAANLEISPLALSDREDEGRLVFGPSSELNALGESGAGETVRITSLDREDATRGWSSPDFVKIDAEGQEERILAGGRDFFARHSPLIMFEIKAADRVNDRLRALFPSIGYGLFRQLGGAPFLVPDDPQQPVDAFELNLFAAKPDRASALAQQGFLADKVSAWVGGADAGEVSDRFWQTQEFGQLFEVERTDRHYDDSLVAYAAWRATDQPVATRCAALATAVDGLRGACERAPTAGRLSTLARAAWEWGARGESVAVLRRLIQTLQSGQIELGERFWPAHPRFDHIAPGNQPANWFGAAVAEQFEQTFGFSSTFSGASPTLPWLCTQPFTSSEMERRRILVAARLNQHPTVSKRLRQRQTDHLNAEVWRAGKVPGTLV